MSDFINEISTMTDVEEVRNIADAAKNRLKNLTKMNLRKGSKVQILEKHQGAKPYDAIGTVERVNTKTVSVDFGIRGKWRVSPAMLNIVD